MLGKSGAAAAALLLATSGVAFADDTALQKLGGSTVSLSHYASAYSFYKDAEPDYNPIVIQAFNLDPRFQLDKKITLKAHLELATELTDSDDTSREREPLLGDLSVSAAYALPHLSWGLVPSATVGLILPTSRASWARELYLGAFAQGGLSRSFQVAKGIKLIPAATLRASGNWAGEQQTVYDDYTIVTCEGASIGCDELNHSGSRASRAGLQEGLSLGASFPYRLSAAIGVVWVQSFLYPLAEVIDPTTGEVIPAAGPNTRYLMSYDIGVEWAAHKNVTVAGGFQTVNPQQKPDSEYYAPFLNRYTQLYLSAAYVF